MDNLSVTSESLVRQDVLAHCVGDKQELVESKVNLAQLTSKPIIVVCAKNMCGVTRPFPDDF